MADTSSTSSTEAKARQESVSTLRKFSWSYWLILTTIVASLAFYYTLRIGQAETSLLKAQIRYTPFSAYEALSALGPEGREIYRKSNLVNLILAPIVFREYLLNTFPATSARSYSIRDLLANVYFLGDVLEQTCVVIMLKTYPKIVDVLAWTGHVGYLVKTFGICLCIVSVLYEAFVWLRGTKAKKH